MKLIGYASQEPRGKRDPLVKTMERNALRQAVADETERCREAVLTTLREIGAAPGSSIDSACNLILLRIERKR
jgi:hypothetical protein